MNYFHTFNVILTLISAVFVGFLGIIVFFRGEINKKKISFLFLSLSFFGWLFGTFKLLSCNSIREAFFWDKFIYSSVIFIPAFLYHFVYIFTGRGKRYIFYISYIFSFFFLFTILFTDFFVDDFFEYSWGIHTKARFFHHLFLLVFAYFLVEVYKILFFYYKENRQFETRRQTSFLLCGFLILGIIGSSGFLPAYEISIYPFSHYAALFFVLIVVYAITKYNLLGVRIIASYFLIVLLNIISFLHIFFSKNDNDYIIEVFSFILVLIISYLLKTSFSHEIKQSENLKQLSGHLKKAIESLSITNKKLKELDKAKNEFLSVAAHQLRTPATAVKGYTAMILDGNFGKCEPDVMIALKKVYQANERMTCLVEDLLNTSRIESGHLKYDFQKVNVQDILKELEYTFSIRVKDTKIKFLVNYPEEVLPEIVADKNKIREVISNLIDNAIKYTIEGDVKVFLSQEENFVKIIVEDTGRGMTERTLTNLFKKFSRGEESSSEVEGTGLGLFVVKKLVEKHGGFIIAESEGLGKGSKFTVKLPIEREESIEELNEEEAEKETREIQEMKNETKDFM